MRFAIAVSWASALLGTTGCFDFSVTRFGGEGDPCGEPERECRQGFVCASDNKCTRDCDRCGALVAGDTCASSADCKKGHCAEGICCESACDGVCSSCDEARTGQRRGICALVPTAAPPIAACGGSACDGAGNCRRQRGDVCNTETECSSGFCADGVCCDTSCEGLCQSCAASLTGGGDGICLATLAYRESADECAGSVTCDGAGDCYAGALGTACTQANECLSGFCADGHCCESECDGVCRECSTTGACELVADREDSGTCDDSRGCTQAPCVCTDDGSCAATGGSCTAGPQCASGYCSDGICCETPCDGVCQSCRASETGGVTGQCSNILVSTDPDGECEPGACNGQGACERSLGAACTTGTQCVSGFCIDGACCENACIGACNSCNANLTNAASGVCAMTRAGLNPGNACNAYPMADGSSTAGSCDGNGQCAKAPNGAFCMFDHGICAGSCVPYVTLCDGYTEYICCESACDQPCHNCRLGYTGQANGLCRPTIDGQDPLRQCNTCSSPNALTCNGSGGCD